MHSTESTCCPEAVTIEIKWCVRTSCYRVRGQWAPDQLQFWDDALHDVEITVESDDEIRGAVVQVLRHFSTLLRLSPGRAGRELAQRSERR